MNGLNLVFALLCLGLSLFLVWRVSKWDYSRSEKYLLYTLIFLLAAIMIVSIIIGAAQKQLEHYQYTQTVHMVQ